MKTAQIFSAASLISLVIALAIVLAGQKEQVETLLAPGSASDASRSKVASDSVIGEGEIGKAATELETLVREALYNTAGSSSVSDPEALKQDLLRAEPQIPLGEPVSEGGVSIDVVAKSKIVFCSQPNFYAICHGIDIDSRRKSEAQNHKLALAKGAVIAGLSGKNSRSNSNGPTSPGTATGDAIEKLKQLRDQGVR